MSQPPRDTRVGLAGRRSIAQWLLYGAAIFAVTLTALLTAPGAASQTEPSVPVTMAFVVICLGSVLAGMAMRRDPASGFAAPVATALKWLWIPVALTVVSVEVGFMQRLLMTTSLDTLQWWTAIGLSLVPAVVVEADKAIRRAIRR